MRVIATLALLAAVALPQPVPAEPVITVVEAPITYAGELLTPSNLTAAELEAGLLKDLKPLAAEFIRAEEETGVNAVFLAAVAALESGWGTSKAAQSRNNLFGWGKVSFGSKAEGIHTVAAGLKANYLTEGGKYFYGYTVEAVSVRYCNGSTHWQQSVRQIMRDIERRANNT